jgi:DNA mismatch repair ATPase MutS
MLARDGNFVREGYSPPLDEFRMLRDESKRLIATLETRYQQETGISGLKIRFNNVLGYYAEITPIRQKKSRTSSSIANPWPMHCATPPQNLVNWSVKSARRLIAQ